MRSLRCSATALAIWEESVSPNHPEIATGLNNLALLLKATKRMGEAEPLMRRQVEIFVKFSRATDRAYPKLEATINNYARLLDAMGHSQEQILADLRGQAPEFFG